MVSKTTLYTSSSTGAILFCGQGQESNLYVYVASYLYLQLAFTFFATLPFTACAVTYQSVAPSRCPFVGVIHLVEGRTFNKLKTDLVDLYPYCRTHILVVCTLIYAATISCICSLNQFLYLYSDNSLILSFKSSIILSLDATISIQASVIVL